MQKLCFNYSNLFINMKRKKIISTFLFAKSYLNIKVKGGTEKNLYKKLLLCMYYLKISMADILLD